MRTNITSAAGVLALLEEPETEIKYFALQKLNHIVNQFWAEISESVDKVEMLYEDETFKHRNLAALVASKVKIIPRFLFFSCGNFLPPANEVWGKVMSLHLSVILFMGGGWQIGRHPLGRPPPPSRQLKRWYASCWNAFLFTDIFGICQR